MRPRLQTLNKSETLMRYAHIQSIAKTTMEFLFTFIKEGVSAIDIKNAAETFMRGKGVDSFWYYNIGAFVLIGEQTTISISGKEYCASNLEVKSDDLVTVDLSPEIDGFWGDLARSFVIRNGKVVEANQSESMEIDHGMKTMMELHEMFMHIVKPNTTFEEAYAQMNSLIKTAGFVNLDFNKNLGHSIVKHIDERIFIESGNKARFRDIDLFTFEPHIKKTDGKYGFKHENIYYFEGGKLQTL